LLKGYTEVYNQLASQNNLQQIYDLRSEQVEALEQSFDISTTLFNAARVDCVESLLTKRDLLEAQMELAEVTKQQQNLYKALGGCWLTKRLNKTNISDPLKVSTPEINSPKS
jgi:outer membrane protein, multidrug efflux system